MTSDGTSVVAIKIPLSTFETFIEAATQRQRSGGTASFVPLTVG